MLADNSKRPTSESEKVKVWVNPTTPTIVKSYISIRYAKYFNKIRDMQLNKV